MSVLKSSGPVYLVMVVGMVMVIIYWGQSNLQFGNLVRTDGKHAALSIIQTFSLMLYFYFVRLDVELGGAVITLKMESIFMPHIYYQEIPYPQLKLNVVGSIAMRCQ